MKLGVIDPVVCMLNEYKTGDGGCIDKDATMNKINYLI